MPRGPAIRSFLPSVLAASAAAFALLPGCSSDAPPVAQAGITVDVIPGQNGAAACPVGGGVTFNVGGDNLTPTATGDSYNGAGVSVTCAVDASGSGFSLSGNISIANQGTFVVSGQLDGTRNPQNNISGTFSDAGGLGSWTSRTCVITYPGNTDSVASGKIWAHIECATATDPNHSPPTVCDASADFRFENCN